MYVQKVPQCTQTLPFVISGKRVHVYSMNPKMDRPAAPRARRGRAGTRGGTKRALSERYNVCR